LPVDSHWLTDALEDIAREGLFRAGIWKRATLADVTDIMKAAHADYPSERLVNQPHPMLRRWK
jgi:hypothetical protein